MQRQDIYNQAAPVKITVAESGIERKEKIQPLTVSGDAGRKPSDQELYGIAAHWGDQPAKPRFTLADSPQPPPHRPPELQVLPGRNAAGRPSARASLRMPDGSSIAVADLTDDLTISVNPEGAAEFLGSIMEPYIERFKREGIWLG